MAETLAEQTEVINQIDSKLNEIRECIDGFERAVRGRLQMIEEEIRVMEVAEEEAETVYVED